MVSMLFQCQVIFELRSVDQLSHFCFPQIITEHDDLKLFK
jgi:hypothetical protein